MPPHPSSFRDPAGFIFEKKSKLYRQVNRAGKEDYDLLISSGLYEELVKAGLMIAHREVDPKGLGSGEQAYKITEPEKVPFISYPYEWTFSQLKDAALLTIKVQRLAFEYGMTLKDASAYNIQFVGKKPVFIDTLSFKKYQPGEAWEGYKQFCEHFLAPLAISVYDSSEFLRAQKAFIDGIPLPLAVSLLPKRARINRGLLTHIFLHAASQKRYDSAGHKAAGKVRKVSPLAYQGLMLSLEKAVNRLKPKVTRTEWGEYYSDTNYSDSAFKSKSDIVSGLLKKIPKKRLAWDLGANDGTFSKITASQGAYTVAFDIDMNAVEQNYHDQENVENLLPLVQDFSNPSPDLGWGHSERSSLAGRGPADVALALALIHHLAIGNNLPFKSVADYFSKLADYLIIEFVPKEDSKVQLLLASRKDIFDGYHQEGFEEAFEEFFELKDKKSVTDSRRVIYLYKAKANKYEKKAAADKTE